MKKNLLLFCCSCLLLLALGQQVLGCDFSLPEIVSYQKTGATSYTVVIKVCAGGGGQGADDATDYIGILLPVGANITSFSPAEIENGVAGATTVGTGSCTDCLGPLSGAVTGGRALEFGGDLFEDVNATGSKRRTCQDVTINFTSATDLSGQTIYVVGMEDDLNNPGILFNILTDVNPTFTFTPTPSSSTGNCTDAALNCTYHCTFGLKLDTPTPQTDLYVVGGSSGTPTSGVGDNICTAFQVTAGTDCSTSQYNIINFRNATKTSTPAYAGTCGYASGAGNGSSSTQDDIWMTATVPASGTLDIELFKTDKVGSGTIEDLAVAIYTGTFNCATSGNSLVLAGCNDDKYTRNYAAPNNGISVNSSTGYFMPHLTQTGLTAGSLVYIRIFDPTIAGTGTSNFYVNISDGSKPADNICGSANTISNSNVSYDTRYCRRSDLSSNLPYLVTNSTCGGSVENPIWFTFTSDATGTAKTIEFNNINCSHAVYDPDNTPSNNDGLQVYLLSNSSTSDCSGTWSNVTCTGTGTWNTGSQTFSTGTLTPNTKYYLMVDGYAGDACAFDLRFAPAACPTLSSAPPAVTINNSTCTTGCAPSNGSFAAPTGTPCPVGSTLQYSTDNGGTWSATLPTYDQDGPAQTVLTRCNCDSDTNISSPTATATTTPGTCTPAVAGINAPATTVITCTTTNINLTATGGGTYAWTTTNGNISAGANTATATVTAAGTYQVQVTAANGCTDTETIAITANNTPPSSPSLTPSCVGATSTLTAAATAGSGGTLSYAITGLSGTGGVFNTGVTAGTTYTVTITESGSNCTTTAQATASSCSGNFGEFASAVYLQTCSGSSFYNTTGAGANIIQPGTDFTGSLGTFFQNSGGLQLDGAEIKTWKNAGANVCEPELYYVVYPTGSRPALPTFTPLTLKYKAGCPGPSSSFEDSFGQCNSTNDQKWQYSSVASPHPGGPYLDANVDLTAQSPGNYTIEVYYSIPGSNTTTNQCNEEVLVGNPSTPSFTMSYTIVAPAALSSNDADNTVCSNANSITLTATPATGSYQWSAGATPVPTTATATASPTSTTTYTVTVSTPNGCQSTTTRAITVNQAPTGASLTPSCVGTTPILTATATAGNGGTLSYAITGLSGTGGVFNIGVTAGTNYTVTVTEVSSNCTTIANATATSCVASCGANIGVWAD